MIHEQMFSSFSAWYMLGIYLASIFTVVSLLYWLVFRFPHWLLRKCLALSQIYTLCSCHYTTQTEVVYQFVHVLVWYTVHNVQDPSGTESPNQQDTVNIQHQHIKKTVYMSFYITAYCVLLFLCKPRLTMIKSHLITGFTGQSHVMG